MLWPIQCFLHVCLVLLGALCPDVPCIVSLILYVSPCVGVLVTPARGVFAFAVRSFTLVPLLFASLNPCSLAILLNCGMILGMFCITTISLDGCSVLFSVDDRVLSIQQCNELIHCLPYYRWTRWHGQVKMYNPNIKSMPLPRGPLPNNFTITGNSNQMKSLISNSKHIIAFRACDTYYLTTPDRLGIFQLYHEIILFQQYDINKMLPLCANMYTILYWLTNW